MPGFAILSTPATAATTTVNVADGYPRRYAITRELLTRTPASEHYRIYQTHLNPQPVAHYTLHNTETDEYMRIPITSRVTMNGLLIHTVAELFTGAPCNIVNEHNQEIVHVGSPVTPLSHITPVRVGAASQSGQASS